MVLVKNWQSCSGQYCILRNWKIQGLCLLGLFFFLTEGSFEFSPGFADAQAPPCDSRLASRDGCAQQWVISSSPSPDVGTNDTSLPGYCLETQHCHQRAYRAARVILCHRTGDRKPYKTSLTNPCCLCPLTQGLWPSERTHPDFCLPLAPGSQSRSPFLSLSNMWGLGSACQDHAISKKGVKEKCGCLEQRQMKSFLLNLAEEQRRGCQEVWNKVSCCFCNCLIGQNNSLLQGDPLLRLQQGNAIQNKELSFLNKPIVFIELPFYAITVIA